MRNLGLMNACYRAFTRECFICGRPLAMGEEWTEVPMEIIAEQRRVAAWVGVVPLPRVVEMHWEHASGTVKKKRWTSQ